MLDINQLYTPLTKEQVKAKLYELAAALGLPTTSWVSGSPTRVLIAILAEIYGAFIAPLTVLLAKSGFLEDAEGSWLTLLAFLTYGVTRRDATQASTDVTLTYTGGGVYTFDPGEFVVQNSATGATYTNTETFTLNGPTVATFAVAADVAGSASNAGIGDIDTVVTVLLLASVTNADEAIGVDEESDPELRDRCRAALGALSPNGPADVYRYIALTPERNGGANITRVLVKPSTGDGIVTVVLAGPDGAPTAGDVALVQAGFDAYAQPTGVTATAFAAAEQALTYTANVIVSTEAGLTNAQWQTKIKEELVAYIRTVPIEGIRLADPPAAGKIPWRTIEGVIERIRLTTDANALYYVKQATLSPETDVTVSASRVATLELADIAVNITQVAG